MESLTWVNLARGYHWPEYQTSAHVKFSLNSFKIQIISCSYKVWYCVFLSYLIIVHVLT